MDLREERWPMGCNRVPPVPSGMGTEPRTPTASHHFFPQPRGGMHPPRANDCQHLHAESGPSQTGLRSLLFSPWPGCRLSLQLPEIPFHNSELRFCPMWVVYLRKWFSLGFSHPDLIFQKLLVEKQFKSESVLTDSVFFLKFIGKCNTRSQDQTHN